MHQLHNLIPELKLGPETETRHHSFETRDETFSVEVETKKLPRHETSQARTSKGNKTLE